MGARLRGAGIGARGAGMGASRKLIASRPSTYVCTDMTPCFNSILSWLTAASMALIIMILLRLIYLRGVTSLT